MSRSELQSFSVAHSDGPALVSFTNGKRAAYVAAGSFLVTAFIGLLIGFGGVGHSRPHVSLKEFESLNATDIKEIWDFRRSIRGAEVSASFFGSFAWTLMFVTILCLSQVLGRKNDGIKTIMTVLFGFGATTITLEFFLRAGLATVADWMDAEWVFDTETWQAAEVAYTLIEGSSVWLFAADWLFLCLGFVCLGVLTWNHNVFTKKYSILVLVGAVLAGFAFLFELLRFARWEAFSIASAVVLFPLGIIVIPMWLFSSGQYLGRLAAEGQ